MTVKNFALLGLIITAAGCHKHDETLSENITTVQLNLVSSAPNQSFNKVYTWTDEDGDGGKAPMVDTIQLPMLSQANCEIKVFDRSQTPEKNITEEIVAERNDHLFVYTTDVKGLTINYADKDDEGKNFGQKTTWSAMVGSGKLTIRLYHEPSDKDKLDNPGGEIDFEVTFPISIK